MKASIMTNILTVNTTTTKLYSLLIALFVMSPAGLAAADKAAKRHALVYLSDGTEYEGIVQLIYLS